MSSTINLPAVDQENVSEQQLDFHKNQAAAVKPNKIPVLPKSPIFSQLRQITSRSYEGTTKSFSQYDEAFGLVSSPISPPAKQIISRTHKFSKAYIPEDSSEDDIFYEASPLLDHEYHHFSAILPTSSALRLDESLSSRTKQSVSQMYRPLISDETPFKIPKGTYCEKSNKVAPFNSYETTDDEIALLCILNEELYSIDHFEKERLIDDKLNDLGYDKPTFWQWSDPRDYFKKRPWAKHLVKCDDSDSETSQDVSLDDIYAMMHGV